MAQIAVIDDDPIVFHLLETALAPRHAVHGYQSGRAALEGLLRVPPQLVLLDINLGDMSGIELARAIRDNPAVADVPIFAITGYTEDSVRSSLMAEGFTGFVAKPITDVPGFVTMIEAALSDDAAGPMDEADETDEREPAAVEAAASPLKRAVCSALAALEGGDASRAAQLLRDALAADKGG